MLIPMVRKSTSSIIILIFEGSSVFYSFPVGTSDPYVKFKIAGKEVFRSKTIHKNLNPVWDERVSLLVETLRDPLYVKVQQISDLIKYTVPWTN